MVSRKELAVWKKLLGNKVESFTTTGKQYTVFYGEHGWECDCPDFEFRQGSHTYEVIGEDGTKTKIQSCKHVGQFLADQGLEVYETYGWYGPKEKIEPHKKQP